MKRYCLSEEISTKSIVRVVENFVLVASISSRGIFAEKLDFPEKVSTLVSFSGSGLSVVVDLYHFADITGLDSQNLELNSEGGSRKAAVTVEQVTETCVGHV